MEIIKCAKFTPEVIQIFFFYFEMLKYATFSTDFEFLFRHLKKATITLVSDFHLKMLNYGKFYSDFPSFIYICSKKVLSSVHSLHFLFKMLK